MNGRNIGFIMVTNAVILTFALIILIDYLERYLTMYPLESSPLDITSMTQSEDESLEP